jgi:hypothetical protein
MRKQVFTRFTGTHTYVQIPTRVRKELRMRKKVHPVLLALLVRIHKYKY